MLNVNFSNTHVIFSTHLNTLIRIFLFGHRLLSTISAHSSHYTVSIGNKNDVSGAGSTLVFTCLVFIIVRDVFLIFRPLFPILVAAVDGTVS